jgi:uncharacterized RDD family membrane protein YckC
MSRISRVFVLFGVGIALSVASLATPFVGWLCFLPGLAAAFGIQFAARSLGLHVPSLDGDEVPGPVAFGIGVVVNAVCFALAGDLLSRTRLRRERRRHRDSVGPDD